jgi:eukaryotic-like serine/threonine-protein kinase
VAVAEQFPAPFGRYHLLSRLAVGGMAELYLARAVDAPDDAPFAVLKRLLPHLATERDYIDMFLDEARLTSQLEHAGLIRIYEFGRCEGEYFIAMEFVDGIDVLTMLRECAALGRRMMPEIGVYIAHQFLDALDYVHGLADENGQPLHIVHRDVSPSNVLVSQTGEVKLIDFGIARAEQRLHRTRAGLLKGKVGYMSPEQVSRTEIDARSDIFSAGVVLAELLMGRRLFVAARELDTLLMVRYARLDRLERHGHHIDAEVQDILRRALRQQPQDRYATAAEFRDALGTWLRAQPRLSAQIRLRLGLDGDSADGDGDGAGATAALSRASSDQLSEHGDGQPSEEGAERMAGLAATLGLLVRKLYPRAWQRQQERSDGTERDVEPPIRQSVDLTPTPRLTPPRRLGPGDTVPDLSAAVAHEEATVAMVNPLSDWLEQGQTEDLDDLGRDLAAESGASGTAARTGSVPPVDALRPYGDVDEPASSTRETIRGLPLALLMEAMAGSMPDTVSAAEAAAPAAAEAEVEFLGLAPTPVSGTRMLQGSLSESSPLAVLHHLAHDRATGRLSMATGEIRKDIHLRDGVVVQVASNVFTEHFGEHLVRHGAVSPGELSMVLAMVAQYQESLDDALVSLHLLSVAEVAQQRAALMRQQIIDVCTWTRGTYQWHTLGEVGQAPGPAPLPGMTPASGPALELLAVIGAGALAVPDEAVNAWLERLGAADRIRPRLTDADAMAWRVFQLGPFLDEACGLLDGRLSVDELRAHFARTGRDARFLRVLHLLYQAGLATSGA